MTRCKKKSQSWSRIWAGERLGQIAGFEILRTFENINKVIILLQGVNKWGGDAAVSFADTQLAERFLSWRAGL